jgi:hypothetical protein
LPRNDRLFCDREHILERLGILGYSNTNSNLKHGYNPISASSTNDGIVSK